MSAKIHAEIPAKPCFGIGSSGMNRVIQGIDFGKPVGNNGNIVPPWGKSRKKHMSTDTTRITKRALWRIYVVAFLLLTITVTMSHMLADLIVRQQHQYASIINISGRQRMLSQRISGLIALAFLQRNAAERNNKIALVDEAIGQMEKSHEFLTNRGDITLDTAMSQGISAIYFGAENLDQRIRTFIATARHLRDIAQIGEPADREELRNFADRGFSRLIATLELTVAQYQKDAEAKLDYLRTLNVGLWLVTIAIILLELLFIFRPLARRLDAAQQKLEDIAHTDPLTGCWNRRALMSSGEPHLSLATRQDRALSVIICDIDKFKNINDTYGHGVGDEAIKEFARTCLGALRPYDLLGRYGGEEFVLVLPDTNEIDARAVAERIRTTLEAITVKVADVTFKMTASFGTATLANDTSLQGMIDRADLALYAAKQNGRNRVESWHEGLA